MRHLASFLACTSLGLAATVAGASSPPGVTVSEVSSFHYASAVTAPRTLRLAAFNGGITVSPSTDGTIDVHAVVTDGDPARVRVVTREEAGSVAVCVQFADESPDGCRASGGDRPASGRKDHQNGPTVDLVARVPSGVLLTAGTLNGAIQARGLGGEVHATTLNGDVTVSAGNVAEATTLNGNVDVSFAAPPAGRVTLGTNNGNVKVCLPRAIDAEIEASTVHGEITATFPMSIATTPGGWGPKNGQARLGKGGPRIQIRSINGNVEIRGGS